VQSAQGGRFTFETVKDRYEKTIPLRGKRKEQNIRPINRRDRAYERIVKVSDTEYYVTFDAYTWRTAHNKAITWSLNNGMEFMTIHTPRKTWGNPSQAEWNTLPVYPRTFSSASVFWFYDFNLPQGFNIANYYVNKYLKYNDKYYTIEKGDIVFQRKVGSNEWQPLVLHREFKHHIDRAQAKELKQTIKPFLDYFNIMVDVVEGKYEYGNYITRAINPEKPQEVTPQQVWDAFKPSDTVPDSWLLMTEAYKRQVTYSKRLDDGSWSETKIWKDDLPKAMLNHLYQSVKPFKQIEVPLGQKCIDRYKSLFR
jgi:hypothetical protein